LMKGAGRRGEFGVLGAVRERHRAKRSFVKSIDGLK
jgi:hypothetical protein